MVRVGVDVMGGDFFPQAPIEGALLAHKKRPEIDIVLVGQTEIIEGYFEAKKSKNPFEIIHAPSYIKMDENPARAVASKKDSSISVGLSHLKEHKLDAFVSAGNTGAIVVGSVLIVGLIPGVLRPTLAVVLPDVFENKPTLLCDVGANVDCKPEQLVQFGQLGTVFMQAIFQMENPKVALLNIGEEATKGNAQAKRTYKLLKEAKNINFIGNLEGKDIIHGKANVLVCDGFVGNIVLKYGESFYYIFKKKIPNDPILKKFNFEYTGGLPLLGVNEVVIIGHGMSGPRAIQNMIFRAQEMKKFNLTEKIKAKFTI